ncbi:hypothetical protein LPJ53_001130 [Coemansia erecta]|uniref:Phosphoribosyltransferase domain-containing protein n=1 Tax=Coemansia erecta TaxID=147472 RepID=A0A9W8CT60_9FUNG|nr:hypothetical protein LPJ53_001130 [Coemansia erecta]
MVNVGREQSSTHSRGHVSGSPDGRVHSSARGRQAMFVDRIHAGRLLAGNLQQYVGDPNVAVMSISRGGAVIGSVIAEALGADIPHIFYLVRPIPCASLPRLSLGSVAGDGSVRLDNMVAKSLGLDMSQVLDGIAEIDARLRSEQMQFERPIPSPESLAGKTLLVVDDGMEAGDMMREAIMHLRHCYAAGAIVVAVPVCLADLRKQLKRHVECVVDVVSSVCVGSVARWYERGVRASGDERRVLQRLFVGPSSSRRRSGFDFE